MNLIQILRSRIERLVEGAHTAGLRAVLQHVEVASNHLTRGTESGDDTAFTDVIYRTNQAFEGSLKEAYRVLAKKDPDQVRPYDIEYFFQQQSIFRDRVLEQMSRYRKEWRNPSTHDYKLDFDENEGLLAIVSVSAFAIVLIDQITETLNYEHARVAATPTVWTNGKPLVENVANALVQFRFQPTSPRLAAQARGVELVGALAGYLDAALPNARIVTEAKLGDHGRERADILVEADGSRVLVEVKRGRHAQNIFRNSLAQLSHYIAISGIRDAVLYFQGDTERGKMEMEEYPLPGANARIIILRPSIRRSTGTTR